MKKTILLILTIFLIIIIYNLFNTKKINYVMIGDNLSNSLNDNFNKYIYNYLEKSNRLGNFNTLFSSNKIDKLIENIKINKTIRWNNKDYYIKKVLRESDLLIVSIGIIDLYNNYDKYDINNNYKYINKLYDNISNLIMEIKKYTKGKIVFLGYYNPTDYYDSKTDELFYNLDYKLYQLMDNDIIYIDLYNLIKGNKYKDNNHIYLNSYAHKKIASIIEFYIN